MRPDTRPFTRPLATFRDRSATGWDDAWVGIEPTFQSRKSVAKWRTLSAVSGGEDRYFECDYMLRTQKEVARAIVFVASPAASLITGVNLVADNGFTKRVQL